MAVLNREQFFDAVQNIVGTNTDDVHLQFVEDMTDTFNDLESRAGGENVEALKEQIKTLDEAWRKKYRERFFSGDVIVNPVQVDVDGEEMQESTIESLFNDEKKGE